MKNLLETDVWVGRGAGWGLRMRNLLEMGQNLDLVQVAMLGAPGLLEAHEVRGTPVEVHEQHHLVHDVVGQEAVLHVGHFHVHGDAVVAGSLLGGWHHPERQDLGLRTRVARVIGGAQQPQAGLEAVVRALQPQLILHLRVDVLQRGCGRAVRVTVVPAHQAQTPQEQTLVDLLLHSCRCVRVP